MSENKPKVSVLIPAYNAQDFISRTLQSVLKQRYADFEVIILDDGSTDKTAEIVKQIAREDKRIRYYFQENRGLANTRNRLAELADAEYIAFLDHDDEWLPQKLSLQVDFFEKNPDFGLLYSDTYIKKDGRIIGRAFEERKPVRGNVFYELLFENFVPLDTVFMPKRVLLEFIPFNPEYDFSEEFDIFLRVSKKYKFAYLNEVLAVHYRHNKNLSDSRLDKFIQEEFSILNHWLKQEPDIGIKYRRRLDKRMALLYAQKALYLIRNFRFSDAKEEIRVSLKYRPFNFAALKLSGQLFFKRHSLPGSHDQDSLCA